MKIIKSKYALNIIKKHACFLIQFNNLSYIYVKAQHF